MGDVVLLSTIVILFYTVFKKGDFSEAFVEVAMFSFLWGMIGGLFSAMGMGGLASLFAPTMTIWVGETAGAIASIFGGTLYGIFLMAIGQLIYKIIESIEL